MAVGVGLLGVGLLGTEGSGAQPRFESPQLTVAATAPSQETDTGSAAHEFIELGWVDFPGEGPVEGFPEGSTRCESPELEVIECVSVGTWFHTSATHIGHGRERITSWIRTGPCQAPDGSTTVGMTHVENGGTIVSEWGDKIHFRGQWGSDGPCLVRDQLVYWEVLGGTGRFEDASGTMSEVRDHDTGEVLTVGTIRVRKDLFEQYLPQGAEHAAIVVGHAVVAEGDTGSVTADVLVELSYPATEPVTVDWATVGTGDDGYATGGIDFVETSGTLTFQPGETEQTITVTVNGDTEPEPSTYLGEWGFIELSDPSDNAYIAPSALEGRGVFAIVDDD